MDTITIATTEFLHEQIRVLTEQLKNQTTKLDYWFNEKERIKSQLINLIDISYTDELDSSEILERLCDIVDYNPIKEIDFTATIEFSGRIEVPIREADDFNIEEALQDAYVDINDGNIVIDSQDIEITYIS